MSFEFALCFSYDLRYAFNMICVVLTFYTMTMNPSNYFFDFFHLACLGGLVRIGLRFFAGLRGGSAPRACGLFRKRQRAAAGHIVSVPFGLFVSFLPAVPFGLFVSLLPGAPFMGQCSLDCGMGSSRMGGLGI